MTKILEQTRLLSKSEVEKLKQDFQKKGDIIKGNCFEELLDNIDKHRN